MIKFYQANKIFKLKNKILFKKKKYNKKNK